MRVIRSIHAMQRRALRWRADGVRMGFVPTMGCLHAAHLSLVRRARRAVGLRGKVILSIYVNPTQFGPSEDFARYPRPLRQDLQVCRSSGVDLVFLPSDSEMYPGRETTGYHTYVVEEDLSRGMEGASRPAHFRGVTTVVTKLLHLVLPHLVVFGAKDYQQAQIVRRMVRDLNFPVRVVVAPTCRESDGLAISSRNQYLSLEERGQATVLYQCLRRVRSIVRRAESPVAVGKLDRAVKEMFAEFPAVRLDYVAFFDAQGLQPVRRVEPGTHMAVAAYVGRTRLIDNGRL